MNNASQPLYPNFEKTRLIEETGHSTLSSCIWKGKIVVCKKAKQQRHHTEAQTVARWRNEVDLLRRIKSHGNIAEIFDAHSEDLTIILRHESGQSLDKIVDSQQFSTLSLDDSHALLFQMSSALAHLHSLCIIHDDVKADNIMWSMSEEQGERRAVLIDFGAAFDWQLSGPDFFVPSGTPSWTPPEFLRRRKGKEGDVWSLGVVMLFTLKRIALPDGEWILPHALEGGKPREEMQNWLDEVNHLKSQVEVEYPVIGRMLMADPDARISSEELHDQLSHKTWLRKPY